MKRKDGFDKQKCVNHKKLHKNIKKNGKVVKVGKRRNGEMKSRNKLIIRKMAEAEIYKNFIPVRVTVSFILKIKFN
jgi:hypothetical protein